TLVGGWQVTSPWFSGGTMSTFIKPDTAEDIEAARKNGDDLSSYPDAIRGSWSVNAAQRGLSPPQASGRLWGSYDRKERTFVLDFLDSIPGNGMLDGSPA